MDDTGSQTPEYGWNSQQATHAHNYLLPGLIKAINSEFPNFGSKKLKIFDAGCGNGFISGHLIAKGNEVTACDASAMGIQIAKDKYGGRFEVASVYDDLFLRFGSDYDLVVSSEVVEHLYDPRLFAKNMFNLLKPGGKLIVSTPYHGYLKNIAIAVSGKFDHHFTALWDGGHIKFWSRDTLQTLLAEAGFDSFSFFGAGRFPLLWKSMIISATKPVTEKEV
jgi:2-polyprenyl-6-hydroxyphenyl methylase/3-demethylubiquinone-9 3-methyltransferase